MTERVKAMRKLLFDRSYRANRKQEAADISALAAGKDPYALCSLYLSEALAREIPTLLKDDLFGFHRSQALLPVCRPADGPEYGSRLSNVTPDYSLVIDQGFGAILKRIDERFPDADESQRKFYGCVRELLHTTLAFCEQYRMLAKEKGNGPLYQALGQIPHGPATGLYEACLFQKILIYILRLTKHDHITLGRFDQYMFPYYQADVRRGADREQLLEMLELYFLSLNLDTDLYQGVQQGDNGQSMVLGGLDADGTSMFNGLSALCMDASLELEVIDPKINLRVGRGTPEELYAYGTRLTKKGLGFPQYCNDDVVVPGLIRLGYRPEDARDYAVAACWEFTIPGKAADVPNVQTFNFPLVVVDAIRSRLEQCPDFEALMVCAEQAIREEVPRLTKPFEGREHYYFGGPIPLSPLISLLTDGCLEKGADVSEFSARYYNLGCHGAGLSTAADSLAAVKKLIFDENSVEKQELLDALSHNFEGYTGLRNRLLACPKMGNDDEEADTIAQRLMKAFSSALNGRPNGSGGIWRAGTGSAHEYIYSAQRCPATPDGRLNGAPYGSSFSPSPEARLNGPLSVIRSFTKFPLENSINGGPLTMEIHDNVFRNAEGEKKVADLVRLYILSGGHQLQINAINRERLLDAQKHPENYPNLVVRVWGWSGYFRELDPVFQNHIIKRMEFTMA